MSCRGEEERYKGMEVRNVRRMRETKFTSADEEEKRR